MKIPDCSILFFHRVHQELKVGWMLGNLVFNRSSLLIKAASNRKKNMERLVPTPLDQLLSTHEDYMSNFEKIEESDQREFEQVTDIHSIEETNTETILTIEAEFRTFASYRVTVAIPKCKLTDDEQNILTRMYINSKLHDEIDFESIKTV